MFKTYPKLKIFAFFIVIIIGFLILITSNPRKDILEVIHFRTPDPYKDCLTDYVNKNWDIIFQQYDKDIAAGRERSPRGTSDVGGDIASKYLPVCKK